MTERLIFQHFIIFGVDHLNQNVTLKKIIANQIDVQILNIFPEGHEQKNYLADLSIWCYPDGIKIYNEKMLILNDPSPEYSYSTSALQQFGDLSIIPDQINKKDLVYTFVWTDMDLKRRYCTCLTFHKVFIEDDLKKQKVHPKYSKTFPKCSVNKIVTNPLKLDLDSYLVYIPKCILLVSQYPFFELQKQFLKNIYKRIILKKIMNTKYIEHEIIHDEYQQFNLLSMKYGLPKAQKIFDEEYPIQKKKIIKKNQSHNKQILFVKQSYLLQFYISLSFLFRNSSNKLKIMQIVDQNEVIRFHYVTQYECFYPPDINVIKIFKTVNIENILKILKNMILQRQILVFSKRPQFIIQFFQSLFWLIQPFIWENIYIPFLPFHRWKSIDAIGAYIIGMSKIHLNYILEHGNLSNKVIIDLDEQIIIEEGQKFLEFPKPLKQWVIAQIYKLEINKKQMRSEKEEMKQKKWIKTTIKLKLIFFNFILLLMNNFLPFIIQNTEQRNPSISLQFEIDTNNYIAIFNAEDRSIIKQFTKTMMFIRLCEKILQLSKNNCQQDHFQMITLFISCQNIIQQKINKNKENLHWDIITKNKGILDSLLIYQESIINRTQKHLDKKQIYYFQQYLIKYIKFLEFKNLESITNRQLKMNQSTFFEEIQKQNQLYFINMTEKKKNWTYLNKKNSISMNHEKIVDIREVFQQIAISRYNDYQFQENPVIDKKISDDFDRCYSLQPFHENIVSSIIRKP